MPHRTSKPEKPATQAELFGQALRRLRNSRNLSQAQAAELNGSTQATWQRYEIGENDQFLREMNQRSFVEPLGYTVENLRQLANEIANGTAGPEPRRSRAGRLPPKALPQVQEGGRLTLPDYTLAGRDDAEGEAVYEASSPDLFDMTPVIGPSARILRIALDDMAPFVEPGGFITYDTKARPRRNQGVVLKTREGRMIIRRYQRTTPSHILTYKYVPFQHEGDLCYREVAEDIPLQDIVGVYPIGIRAD